MYCVYSDDFVHGAKNRDEARKLAKRVSESTGHKAKIERLEQTESEEAEYVTLELGDLLTGFAIMEYENQIWDMRSDHEDVVYYRTARRGAK